MTEPTVCCVMLTKDRPEMAARAVRRFRAQTYSNKRLLIFDTGEREWFAPFIDCSDCDHLWAPKHDGNSIGMLRNMANPCRESDIICHWDSDDYSHPSRIADQVALLQASGADCVGYNEMLFWDTRRVPVSEILGAALNDGCTEMIRNEAWLYRNPSRCYALGTSLCYWRKAWERFPFDDAPRPDKLSFDGSMLSEYRTFLSGVKLEPERSVCTEPRMIASLHGGNTSSKITSGHEWRRVPEWDAYCSNVMEMK